MYHWGKHIAWSYLQKHVGPLCMARDEAIDEERRRFEYFLANHGPICTQDSSNRILKRLSFACNPTNKESRPTRADAVTMKPLPLSMRM